MKLINDKLGRGAAYESLRLLEYHQRKLYLNHVQIEMGAFAAPLLKQL